MARLSSRKLSMPASPIRKLVPLADEAKARGTRVFHLNIGQPDIPTPEEMMAAMVNAMSPVLAYGPSAGLPVARRAVARFMTRMGMPVDESEVLVTNGGSEAIQFALLAICDPGDEIIVFEPFYTNYAGFANMAGVKLRAISTKVEDGYHLPTEEIISAAITSKTRAILYTSPGNPTGTVLTRDEVSRLIAVAQRHDLFVLADEVYREFVYDGQKFTSVLDVAATMGAEDRVVVLDSISKRFSACGARVGFIVSHNREFLDLCLRFGQARLCPVTLEQYAAAAGYEVLDRVVPPMIEEYRKRRDIVMEGLSAIDGVVCNRPEGAFYLQPSLPVKDADAFARWLLNEFSYDGMTVMIAPGNGFYATPNKGMNEVRIAYVLKEDDLRVAMDLLARAIDAFNQ